MGTFITLEGGEGTGKTTVIKLVQEKLEKEGYNIVLTREPGGTRIAEQIRGVILDKSNTEITGMCEALLFAAARAQHVEELVRPSLKENKIVISDRYFDSNLVYQGILQNIGVDKLYDLNMVATNNLVPDLTVLFDLDPIIGQQRIAANKGREVNRLDVKGLEYHQNIRKGYLTIAKKYPDRIKVIDASKEPSIVAEEVYQLIKKVIKK